MSALGRFRIYCKDLSSIVLANPESSLASTQVENVKTAISESSLVTAVTSSESDSSQTSRKRCQVCRKRLGPTGGIHSPRWKSFNSILGFGCRCGGVFCTEHRIYSDHTCTFDWAAAGRAELSRLHPKVSIQY